MKRSWTSSTSGTSGSFTLGFSAFASSSTSASAPPPGPPRLATEIEALVAIFRATGGASAWRKHDGWSSAAAPHSPLSSSATAWFGVTVAPTSGRITTLSLSNNGLTGRLSELVPHLRVLIALSSLRLSGNSLRGFLPAELACIEAMPALSVLDVSQNLLVGTTPRQFAERSRAFEWRDCTANRLSIFYRATEEVHAAEREEEAEVAVNASGSGGAGGGGGGAASAAAAAEIVVVVGDMETSEHVDAAAAAAAGHSLGSVHLTEGVLSRSDCERVVALAEEHARGRGGWRSDRHTMYRTMDIDVRDVPPMLELLNARLRSRIMPVMAAMFGVRPTDLMLEDLFVAKYSVPTPTLTPTPTPGGGEGQAATKKRKLQSSSGSTASSAASSTRHQAALKAHRDDSELSFVLLLNDAADFAGGGTEFLDWSPPFVAAPTMKGCMVSFCGLQRHGGRAITSGTRYILAGFVRVFDEGRVTRKEGNRIFPREAEEEEE